MALYYCISRCLPRTRFVAAALLGFFGLVSAHAAIVELSFSGTYDTRRGTVFGLSGTAVPYSYEITYDTSLNSNPFFFGAGAALGGYTTTGEWHGYSASGITASSLTFGTKTWTTADLSPATVAVGVSADLWFDTDLSVATPTLCCLMFYHEGDLLIGTANLASGQIYMAPESMVIDPFGMFPSTSSDLAIQVVPEPATLTLLALVGLGLGLGRAARQRARRKASPRI
jgi:hypothetical protein